MQCFWYIIFWNDHLRQNGLTGMQSILQLAKPRWIHDNVYISFLFWTLKFSGEKVFWRNGSTNKHKASGNIPAAFSRNPVPPAPKQMPVKANPVSAPPAKANPASSAS